MAMKSFNVFLSYNESDLALVERIMGILERMGISAYSFKHYPEYGEYIPEIVKKNIIDSEYFVVLLTQAGIESQWVNQEIGMAFALKMLIIPIIQTSVESKGFVELRQRIDIELNNPETAISNLIYRFRSLYNVTSIRFQCKNENCHKQFVLSVPSQLEINEAIKNNKDFIAVCPLCKSEVRHSPLTFEQSDNIH
jgi:hypothetical protein